MTAELFIFFLYMPSLYSQRVQLHDVAGEQEKLFLFLRCNNTISVYGTRCRRTG